MKITRERVNARGRREVTVELSDNSAKLLEVSSGGYYRLGNNMGDVVSGRALIEIRRAAWCDISQAWEDGSC